MTLANIFISHSKRDEQLVRNIQSVLINLKQTPIIEEFIPEESKEPIPYEEIRKNIKLSHSVFLFLTDEIVKTEYTKNWVIFEVGLASHSGTPLFVFERKGFPISYPIPYVTDYMLFDPTNVEDILNIQKLAGEIGKLSPSVIAGGLGALIGAPFGPLGIVVGSLGGIALSSKRAPPIQMERIICDQCKVSFNYWSPEISTFCCPMCRKEIKIGGSSHV